MAAERADESITWNPSIEKLPREEALDRLEKLLTGGCGSFWDDARALREYVSLSGRSQSECARKLGRSQAAVANRLRLLRLPDELQDKMQRHSLSERHARALLRFSSAEEQKMALEIILAQNMNVAETEVYVDRCLETNEQRERSLFRGLIQDLSVIRDKLPDIAYLLQEQPREIRLIICIPRKYEDY